MEYPITINARAFVEHAKPENIRKDIEQDPLAFVKEKLTGSRYGFGVSNIISDGVYKEMGYIYNLRPLLKRFIYRQYGHWSEIWALNKTNARHLISGRIEEIEEVTNRS